MYIVHLINMINFIKPLHHNVNIISTLVNLFVC